MTTLESVKDTLNHLAKYGKHCDVVFVANDGIKALDKLQAEYAALVAVAEAAKGAAAQLSISFNPTDEGRILPLCRTTAQHNFNALYSALANLSTIRKG